MMRKPNLKKVKKMKERNKEEKEALRCKEEN